MSSPSHSATHAEVDTAKTSVASTGVSRAVKWTRAFLTIFAATALYNFRNELSAASYSWDGSTDATWAQKNNWTPQSANGGPVAGDILTFDAASASSQFAIDLAASNRAAASMTFASTGSSGFSFSSGTAGITLTISGGLTNNNTNTQTFNVGFVASGTQTWNAASGQFSFAGGLTLSSAITLTLSGTNAITVGGATTLSNNVTLSGTNGIAFNGTFTNSGNNRTLTNNSSGTVTLGAVTLSEHATTGRTLTIGGSGNTTITGVVANGSTGASGLTFAASSGTSTLTLSNAASTYTGVTTLTAGIVSFATIANIGTNSSIGRGDSTSTATNQASLVLNGGTLKYTGVSASTNRLFTLGASGGTIDSSASSAGTLTFSNTGAIAFSGGTGARTLTLTGASNGSLAAIIGDNTGATSLTKSGAGTWTLANAANTYTGVTTVSGGTLSLGTVANIGTNSSIGKGVATNNTTNAASLVLDGGTLKYTGATASTDRLFTLGAAGGTIDSSASSTGILTFSNTGSIAFSGGTGARTLTLTGGSNGSLAAVVGDNTGATSLTKSGAGTWTLANAANTYTGVTTVSGGTLSFGTVANIGTNSSIGKGIATNNTTNAASLVLDGGTLKYTGATASTNRLFTLGAAGGTIDSSASSTGTLTFNNANAIAFSGGTGARTLTLTGGSDGSLAAIIGDNTGATSVTKSGAGTWTLANAANTYTGVTTVSGGTLSLGTVANIGTNSSIGKGVATNNTTNAASLVLDGGTLKYTGATASTDRLFTLGAGGGTIDSSASSTGTLTFSNTGSIAFSGGTGARTLTLTGGSNGSLAAVVGDNTGATSLTKTGAGTWTLVGNNTYSGTTTINGGTLKYGVGNALPTGTAVSMVSGTLDLNNFDGQIASLSGSAGTIDNSGANARTLTIGDASSNTVFSGTITDSGSGSLALTKTNNSTLTLSGNNSYVGGTNINGGTLALGSSGALGTTGTIAFGGGTLQYSASNTTDYSARFSNAASQAYKIDTNGQSVTLASNLTSSGGSMTKLGSGTLTLSGNNSYTGGTNINGGTLSLGSANAIGTTGTISFGGGALQYSASNTTDYSARFSGAASQAYRVDTNGQNVSFGTALTSTGGTFTKDGSGTLSFTGANSFTGAVTINGGAINIQNNAGLGAGSAGTTVASGGALQLQGNLSAAGNGTLTLAGTGVGGTGALVNVTGSNLWAGNIVINGATTTISAGADFGQTMTLGNASTTSSRPFASPPTDANTLDLGNNTLTLTSTGTTQIRVNSRIIGTGNLTVDLNNVNSVVRLNSNYNTYTGTTTVNNGTLRVRTTYNSYPNDPTSGWENYFGINGPLVIGNASNGAGTAVVDLLAGTTGAEVLNFTTNVTINASGKLLNQSAQSINNLIFNGGGQVDLSTNGSLFLNGIVTVNPTAGQTATIAGTSNSYLSLTIHNGNSSSTDRSFVVNGGVGNASDLTISSLINDGGFTKSGTGTMTITSNNSTGYGGQTKITDGILNVQHSNALGQGAGLDAKGTVVSGTGTLQLQATANGDDGIASNTDDNKLTFTAANSANEKLFLNGTGYGGIGALNSKSGTNVWGGAIDLQSNSRVQTDAGLLTLSGNIGSSTDASLDVRGSGNTTISGDIGTGNGGITKNGSGTLTLSGNNTYHGNTTITSGVVSLQHNNGLGATDGTTTVGSGAALELSHASGLTTAEAITINGNGLSYDAGVTYNGALRNVASNNTVSGLVTIGSSSLITANTGTQLTLSGGTSSSNQALTIGTTANNGNVIISGNIANGSGSLTKNGSGSLTLSGASGTMGAVNLNAGSISVGGTTNLTTGAFASSSGTTLTIASGGTVAASYASGTTTYFSGVMAGNTPSAGGQFRMNGADSTATLVFDNPAGFVSAGGMTLTLNGGTLKLTGGGDFVFGTIHITGNTILDFSNSAGTVLSSANLIIDNGVTVTVKNWVSVANNAAASTVWYATSTVNNGGLSGSDINGGTPLGQISFQSYPGWTTTWTDQTVAHSGWFDREIRPTPEPATYGLLFLSSSFALLGVRNWRKKRQARVE